MVNYTDQQLKAFAGIHGVSVRLPLNPVMRQRLVQLRSAYELNDVAYFKFEYPPDVRFQNTYSGEYIFRFAIPRQAHRDLSSLSLSAEYLQQNGYLLGNAFRNMVDWVIGKENLRGDDRIQIVIIDRNQMDKQVWVPLTRVSDINIQDVLDWIDKIVQSNTTLDLPSTNVKILYTKQMAGTGYAKTQVSLNEWLKKKHAVTFIIAPMNDCFFQCLALHLNLTNATMRRSRYTKMRSVEGNLLRLEVGCHEVGEPVAFDTLFIYEHAFEVKINVILGRTLRIAVKSQADYEDSMYLLYEDLEDEGHYHYVHKEHLGALWKKRKWCFQCERAVGDDSHTCVKKCGGCGKAKCTGKDHSYNEFLVYCDVCHRTFYDEQCFILHSHSCLKRVRCVSCGGIYDARVKEDGKSEKHVCFSYQCLNCKSWIKSQDHHECFIQPLPRKEASKLRLAFYDYECYFSENMEHQVFLVVVSLDDVIHTFFDHEDFMLFISQQEDVTFIAHNAARYDSHFVKKGFLKNGVKTQDICNANSIISMTIKDKKVRFIDSCRFITTSLRKFPKTFGFEDISKGFFPYRFFTQATLNYVGPIPDIEWFDFQKLKPEECKEGEKWYEENKDTIIDLRAWCIQYCIDDVKVLKKGCLIFRDVMMEANEGTMDPFSRLTIASNCMEIYRTLFMPAKTIAIFQEDYVRNPKKAHWKSTGRYMEVFEGREVVRRNNRREYFSICLDDGCPRCYKRYRKHPRKFLLMFQLRLRLLEFMKSYPDIIIVEECRYEGVGRMTDGLDIREAFFGGRTEAFQLLNITKEHPIGYFDVTSLYPTVLFNCEMPVGFPVLIEENFMELKDYFGFMQCDVVPPTNLLIPILPSRTDGKLLFDLRPKKGTWTTVELMKAVEKGYRITRIYSVLHFPRRTKDLFKDYIKRFFRMKTEAAGWVELGCDTEEKKQAFREEYARRMEDPTELKIGDTKNDGWYFTAKLMLNSLWGKFGQREAFIESVDTFNADDFFQILDDDTHIVKSIFLHDERARTLTFTKKTSFQTKANTNIAIAAFTTSYARMILYPALDAFGPDLLYCDTDSIIALLTGRVQLPISSFLGDWTCEFKNRHAVGFVTTGAKSYGYELDDGKKKALVKGFKISADSPLQYDLMVRMVQAYYLEGPKVDDVKVQPLTFVLNKAHDIQTKDWGEGGKAFRVTSDKRQVVEDHNPLRIRTVPWGFIRSPWFP